MAYPPQDRWLSIETADGISLEACQVRPDEARGTLVACHPHTLMGGTLDSKVVHTLYLAFRDQGFHALRFNFRGAGKSGGNYEGGPGEQLDVAAAWQSLNGDGTDDATGPIRVLGGYSFGSFVGLNFAASEPGCSHRVGIGLPLSFDYDYGFLLDARDRRPIYLVVGEEDPYCPVPLVEELVTKLRDLSIPVDATLIPGANHMFDRRGHVLRQELTRIAAKIASLPWEPGRHPTSKL